MPQRQANRDEKPRRRRRFAIAFGSLIAALLLAELCLAFMIQDGVLLGIPLPPFGALPHPRQREWLESQRATIETATSPRGKAVFDAELGWTNRAFDPMDSGEWTFDERGARTVRGHERAEGTGGAADPGTPPTRILAFGDSFTFCSEVEDDETWPHRLELSQPGLHVRNFGVSGYGSGQALLRFRRISKSEQADVVCIGFMTENIGRNVNRYRPLYYPRTKSAVAKPRFVLAGDELQLVPSPFESRAALIDAVTDGSILARTEEHEFWSTLPSSSARYSSLLKLFAGYRAYSARQPEPLFADVDGEPFRVTVALLESFHREVLESGARLAPILIFPREKDFERYLSNGSRSWATLTAELDRRELPYIDLVEALADEFAESPDEAFGKSHLSSRANAIVAETVRAWLVPRL